MENKFFGHTTYSVDLARAALADGQKVHCCHPEGYEPLLERLTTREQIEDAEGILFIVTFKDGT